MSLFHQSMNEVYFTCCGTTEFRFRSRAAALNFLASVVLNCAWLSNKCLFVFYFALFILFVRNQLVHCAYRYSLAMAEWAADHEPCVIVIYWISAAARVTGCVRSRGVRPMNAHCGPSRAEQASCVLVFASHCLNGKSCRPSSICSI